MVDPLICSYRTDFQKPNQSNGCSKIENCASDYCCYGYAHHRHHYYSHLLPASYTPATCCLEEGRIEEKTRRAEEERRGAKRSLEVLIHQGSPTFRPLDLVDLLGVLIHPESFYAYVQA